MADKSADLLGLGHGVQWRHAALADQQVPGAIGQNCNLSFVKAAERLEGIGLVKAAD